MKPAARTVKLILPLLGTLVTAPALAHDPGLSTATLRLQTNQLAVQIVFATSDVAPVLDLDANSNAKVDPEELAAARARLSALATRALVVTAASNAIAPINSELTLDDQNNATIHANYPLPESGELAARSAWLVLLPRGHRQFVTLLNQEGVTLDERLLSAEADTITMHINAAAEARSVAGSSSDTGANSFPGFLELGIRHIVTGYDHLLFLFALLMVTPNWLASLKIITSFTVAHSITLAVATLNVVQLPGHVVEPIIAASILYVGIENLFRREDTPGRWLLTFAFGLIHGFGFASVLRELGVGAGGGNVLLPLFSFNLGVELGQLMIAVVVLPFIWILRKKPAFTNRWSPACSVLVAAAGAWWFVQRVGLS